jgi:hypothetical protein
VGQADILIVYKFPKGNLSLRWCAVYVYLLILIAVTPCLPLLIRRANALWSARGVSRFVFSVEIGLVGLLIATGGLVRFFNRRKFRLLSLVPCGLIGTSVLLYCFISNPYELTHVPEYAVLSVPVFSGLKDGKWKEDKESNEISHYIRSALLTGIFGGLDEIYQGALPARSFTWYDVVLNGVGGMVG